MKNNTLYDSENKAMTIKELKDFIDKLLLENPEFENGVLYSDCGNVIHLMCGCINSQDQFKSSGVKTWQMILMDEEAVDIALQDRENWDERFRRENEEYFGDQSTEGN